MTYAKFDDDFPFEMRTRRYSHAAFRLFVCLRCSKRNNLAGIFPTTHEDIALESGLTPEELQSALEELAGPPDPLIRYQANGRRLFIFIIHQLEIEARHLSGDIGRKVRDTKVKAVQTLYQEHPTWPFWDEFFQFYTVCIPQQYPIDTPSTDNTHPSDTPSIPHTYRSPTLTPTLTKTPTPTPTATPTPTEGACAPAKTKTKTEAEAERAAVNEARAREGPKAKKTLADIIRRSAKKKTEEPTTT